MRMEIPEGLYKKVMTAVSLEVEKRLKFRLILNSVTLALSAIIFIAAGIWLYRDLVQTGFIASFTLVFSDGATVMTYWKDFVSSLFEALPYASLVGCLIAVLIFVESTRRTVIERERYYHLSKMSY